jgi:hypothetical protein
MLKRSTFLAALIGAAVGVGGARPALRGSGRQESLRRAERPAFGVRLRAIRQSANAKIALSTS